LPRHKIRVCTVDLSKRWQDIREELLNLIDRRNPGPF